MVTTVSSLAGASAALARETAGLVERLRPSVVVVRDGGRGVGSGVIWQPNGVIVTNYHVTPGQTGQVMLPDGRSFQASVSKHDPEHDLAVLQVPAVGLPAIAVGDSDRLRPGELVFAIGNPMGLPGAVTAGVISASPHRGGMIRADVSLAPGNSGGPLVTAGGEVVGINSMVRMPGLALAVPSNQVTQLLAQGTVERGYLGLSLMVTALPASWITETTGDSGFLVTEVQNGSPAERAGLVLGDVIIGTDGDALASPDTLTGRLASLRTGDPLALLVMRGGQPRTISITAGPSAAKAAEWQRPVAAIRSG